MTTAVNQQLGKVGHLFFGGGFCEDTTEELATHILHDAPGALTKAIFLRSGSEAMDAVLKLVTQYWSVRGELSRINFIAHHQSYHGNTFGALCVTGNQGRRTIYSHWLSENVSSVDACCAYLVKLDVESDEESTLACVPPVKGYFQAVREICDKYGALMVLDETVGKSLDRGFIPISGVLLHQRVFDTIVTLSGAFAGCHIFQAHPVACAVALAVQRIIRRGNLFGNVRYMTALLGDLLKPELEDHPLVGDIRGRVLFWAAEFMLDPEKRTPFLMNNDFSGHVIEERYGIKGAQRQDWGDRDEVPAGG
ncbi:putative class III aminotransferase [Seiridium cardinale]